MLHNIGMALPVGGMAAVALAFDEIIVNSLTAGRQTTLPIRIFSRLNKPSHLPLTNVLAPSCSPTG